MKLLSLLLLIFVPLMSFGQKNADTTEMKIKYLIVKYNDKTINKEEASELKNYIYNIQNIGFKFDEESHDYRAALEPINRAITLWSSIYDTISEANLRKYKAYLLGNLSEFTEAKIESWKAITLFTAKKYDPGVAVSQHDLSLVYALEGQNDSALYYENISNSYWTSVSDSFRIIVSNSQLINLHRQIKKYDTAQKIQKNSEIILNSANIHWNPLINFYYVSYQLYNELNKENLAASYKKLYLDKIEVLKKDGINSKSIYDTR